MNVIKEISRKKGKVDRAREQEIRRIEEGRIYLCPTTGTEQSIKDIYDDFKEGMLMTTRSIDETLDLYLNARNLRHDIWVDLLNRLCAVRGHRFGDIQFNSFIEKNLSNYKKDNNTCNYKKTPDILLLAHKQYVLLGDVTVTKTVNASDRRKYFKYLDIEKDLEKNGYLVRHVNMVIDDRLTNFRSEVQKFIDLEIIKLDDSHIKRAVEYHKTCQAIMTNIPKQTQDPSKFWQRLDEIDRLETEGADLNIDKGILKEYPLLDVNKSIKEMDLINMIKVKTEENLSYFDLNVTDAIKSFDKLIKGNPDREFMAAKSILKVNSNQMSIETEANHSLVLDYIKDISFGTESETKDLLLDLLPTKTQLGVMNKIYNDKLNMRKATSEDKVHRVYGPYQYSRDRNSTHKLTSLLNNQLTKGKKVSNAKRLPKTIDPELFMDCQGNVESYIDYYGNLSLKEPFLDETWDARTNFEFDNSSNEREIYNYVKRTNGAQLGQSLSNFYHRVMHLKTSLSIRDNIYIPPNCSFICVIPKEHAPTNSVRCDLPMMFISRVHKKETSRLSNLYHKGIEYEYTMEGANYIYHVSKLCRLSLDKIAHWNQMGYKIVATSTYLLSTCDSLVSSKIKLVGIMTMLIADSHQKTSEYLDLLKYIAFMPFSDISRLEKLIEDKCDLLIKTKMDVWLLFRLKQFIQELGNKDLLNAIKPKLQIFNATVTRDSLGMSIDLPTFTNPKIRHHAISDFIEEISMMFIIRPKQLYGSQFMDKSINNTVEWNIEYEQEVKEHKTWATEGVGAGNYPFDSKFCFSRDAIFYAQDYVSKHVCPDTNKVHKSLNKSPLNNYMHYNCSLRGCVKDPITRSNVNDLHTTSMDECLKYYKRSNYKDEVCTAMHIATEFIKTNQTMEFSMSEKEQRGGGRPIATPTLATKACLMMIEKPEQAIGDHVANNILVAGKHKLKAQSDCYKDLLSTGAIKGYSQVYQLTEDQSKFSENDNFRKYYYYVSNNMLLPGNIRSLQLACLMKLENREHLVKRIPKSMINNPKYNTYRNHNLNGFRATIGWPQGMCNMISTSIHSIADYWITHAYNLAYPENQVETSGLVHSDDSWLSIACNSLDDFKRFTIFRTYAKRLFCLKLNDKKVWGSRYLGELVSNYNINGNVHLSVAKTLANSFSNLAYQNWTMDVHVQISSIQQAYRNGANLPTLMLISTILRQQMIDCYQVSGYHKAHLHDLPVELGGYPDTSIFEMGVTGAASHYKKILEMVNSDPDSPVSRIILKALRLSIMHTMDKENETSTVERAIKVKTKLMEKFYKKEVLNELDYQSITIPSKGEVFSCVKHIMPKSKKITNTINEINALEFESDGIEMIVTRPNKLSAALGNLKTQSSTMLYDLASQKYNQSSRRLAVSQAIQSSGKVVRICNFDPMTINEMLYFIDRSPITPMTPDMLEIALNDETDISTICESCAFRADYNMYNNDKRKIINKMPNTEDKFKTICRLKNVLLYIIDEYLGTKYLITYGILDEPISVLTADAVIIRKRFSIYFSFYKPQYACNLIMQQYLTRIKSRLWMQPYLNTDSVLSFFCDLYGKTISKENNYKVAIMSHTTNTLRDDEDMINSIYTTSVLNSIYRDCFIINQIKGMAITEAINGIDYTLLNNECYLKFGIIKKLYANDETHLKEYDTRKMYDQIYIKPQTLIKNQWVGKFVALCRYGNTVVQFEGEPENVTITTNKINISDVLNCMHIFVKQNFKYYSYPHPNNWANSAFWQSKLLLGSLFLTSYNRMVTMVSQKANLNSVNLVINPFLKMPVTYNILDADEYLLSEENRVLSKRIGTTIVKVASVPQSMGCPYSSSMSLIPNLIDGFDNEELLHSRVILDLTTKRYFNCSRSDLLKLLKKRTPSMTGLSLINFYVNLLNSFGDLNIKVNTASSNTVSEVTTYQITGVTLDVALDKINETTPEDLSYIEAEFVYDDDIRTGSIYKHTNLTRVITSILSNIYTKVDISSIIKVMFSDDVFTDNLMMDLDSDSDELDEKIDILTTNDNLLDVEIGVIAFIMGNQLDDPEIFSRYNLGDIIKSTDTTLDIKSYTMGKMIVNSMLANIFDVDNSNVDNLAKILSKLKA